MALSLQVSISEAMIAQCSPPPSEPAKRLSAIGRIILAGPTGIFRTAHDQHPQLRGDDVEPFTAILADPVHRVAAARTAVIQRGQTGTFAEVDRLGRHHHPDRAGRADHAPAFSARSTAATAFASAPQPTRTVTQSISTSITPKARSAWRIRLQPRRRTERSRNGASTTAGSNSGVALSVLATASLACGRQPNNCCGVRPCRRQLPKPPRPEEASPR